MPDSNPRMMCVYHDHAIKSLRNVSIKWAIVGKSNSTEQDSYVDDSYIGSYITTYGNNKLHMYKGDIHALRVQYLTEFERRNSLSIGYAACLWQNQEKAIQAIAQFVNGKHWNAVPVFVGDDFEEEFVQLKDAEEFFSLNKEV